MILLEEQLQREGRDYILRAYTTGSTPVDMRFYFYYESLQKDANGQPYLISYDDIHFKFKKDKGGKSYLEGVATKLSKCTLKMNGDNIPSLEEPETMWANIQDMFDFIFSPLAKPILKWMVNGPLRKMKFWGRNNFQPLFAQDGSRIPDAAYNTAMKGYEIDPSEEGSYKQYNSDGTHMSGKPELKVDVSPWKNPNYQPTL